MSRREALSGVAGITSAAALGLAGWPARAETKAVFLGWQGYDEALFVDSFMQDQGISLETTYIGNNDEIVTKLQTGGIGTIDVVTPYMGYVPLLARTNLIEPIDESKVPNLADMLPLFRDDTNVNIDGKLYSTPFTWGSAPMMYNPAVIPTAPESWFDLFKAEYKGKVGMMDDPLGNIMLAARIGTDAESATFLTHDQLKAAIDLLIKVKVEAARMVALSWGELADALARGDVVITFSGWEAIKKFVADKGAVAEYVYPKEGTYAWLDNYCIAKDAPHRDAAYAMCNQIIGVASQLKIGNEFIQGIVNQKAIDQLDAAAKALYPYDDPAGFQKKATFYTFPPLDEDGTHATFSDWMTDYERFKLA
ncbi:MAG: ABC transporter substrate-binding protein [Alphaproteobacteria bacterium]